MNPESLQWWRILCSFWSGQQDTLDHTRKVTQVEQVVGLHWCGQKVEHGFLVHHQCAWHHLLHTRLEFSAKAPVSRETWRHVSAWKIQYISVYAIVVNNTTQWKLESMPNLFILFHLESFWTPNTHARTHARTHTHSLSHTHTHSLSLTHTHAQWSSFFIVQTNQFSLLFLCLLQQLWHDEWLRFCQHMVKVNEFDQKMPLFTVILHMFIKWTKSR